MNDAATSPAAAAQHAPRRPAAWAAALAAAAAAAVITGCSATPSPSAASNPASAASTSPAAAPSSGPASTPAASTSAVATPTTPPTPAPPTPSATAAGPAPVLGQLAGVFAQGQGFGQAEPSKIFNGGDPTGLVEHIRWQSWGGPKAIGYGRAEYVGPNQSVATGRQKPATVVAFHLGTCDGKLMYQAVEWYFPGEHQSFSASHYENICTGSYVPSP
jgi:hypothetical protein